MDKDGHYLTKQPEYETVWAHGANCGIDDLDAIAMMDRLDDDFGIDTIEMGATIGVAMEAGLAKFGDAEAAIRLVKEVGKGTDLGRILGNGAAVTGKVFGIERVPVVKGQAMPAYDPRADSGHRGHLCHEHHGRRSHGRIRCRHEYPQGGGVCGSTEAGRADRPLQKSSDRHCGH